MAVAGLGLGAVSVAPVVAAVEEIPAIVEAVEQRDVARLQVLIDQGADVNLATADGSTALHRAVALDSLDMVTRLLEAGADPEARTRYRISPLALAAARGDATVIERLLASGAEVDGASQAGQTPLMVAARNGRPEAVALLIARGASVDAVDPESGQTALMWAAAQGNAEADEVLLARGADVGARSTGGFTALLFAVLNDRADTARVLLAHGANVDDVAPDGSSALSIAAVNGYFDLASLLLDFGANPNLPDPRGSVLHTVAWLRKPGATGTAAVGGTANGPPIPAGRTSGLELARKMLEHGADPDVRVEWEERRFNKDGAAVTNPPNIQLGRHLLTYNGATPFWVAANNGDVALMRLLAEYGADPLMPSRYGVTPLMVAAGLNYYEGETPGPFTGTPEEERLAAVRLAVELGGDVNARADFGDYEMTGEPAYTLLYYPRNIDELVDLGVGDPRWDGCTALHGSVISGQPSIVQYLVEQGAQLDATCELGWTPLMLAQGVFLANDEKIYPDIEAVLRRALSAAGLPAPARPTLADSAARPTGPGVAGTLP